MNSWLFSPMSCLSNIEGCSVVDVDPIEYDRLQIGHNLAICTYPKDYWPVGFDDETRQVYVMKVNCEQDDEGDVFLFSMKEQALHGPLFYLDLKMFRFRGVAGGFAFISERDNNHATRISLKDGDITELTEDYGYTLGSYNGGVLLNGKNWEVGDITYLGEEGQPLWAAAFSNVREVKLFAEQSLLVCSVWHPHPQVYGRYTTCSLLLVDARTGKSVDTIDMGERLASDKHQVVLEGETLYFRSRQALYTYNLNTRKTKRLSVPEVINSQSFLVAEGKAYYVDNEEEGARLYVVAVEDGQVLGSRLFKGLKLNINGQKLARIEGGFALLLANITEPQGWLYTRVFTWQDGEMEDPNATVHEEPLKVEIIREMEGRDSRYRIRMKEPGPFEEVLRHISIGLESAAHQAAINDSDDTKPYDEDFAGELIADLSNQTLNEEDKRLFEERLKRMNRIELEGYKDAVDQENVKVVTVYP